MNQTKNVILFKHGAISGTDKKALKDAGYIPVACDDPCEVVFVSDAVTNLTGDIVINAAAHALSGSQSGGERERFASQILQQLVNKQKKKETP